MYSVMWSEHCSYKSSRIHLRRFPTEAPWVLVGPGEGAGVVDVGDGIAAALRIESHNHPSFIEPYQGAATGVGGILRDIFSMGARPIAVMDPLRFGPSTTPAAAGWPRAWCRASPATATRWGCRRSAARSCSTRPTPGTPWSTSSRSASSRPTSWCSVGPRVWATSPCCWAPRPAATASAACRCWRRPGSATPRPTPTSVPACRSATPSRRSASSRPASPSTTPAWSSACRTSAAPGSRAPRARPRPRAASGMDVYVSEVPQREVGMEAFEVLTSESQERMLAIVEPEHLDEVLAVRGAVGGAGVGHRHRQRQRAAAGAGLARRRGRGPRRRAGALPRARRAALRPAAAGARRPRRPPRRRSRGAPRRARPGHGGDGAARRCSPTPPGCRRSTTTSCSSTPSRGRVATPPCCASSTPSPASTPGAAWRSPPTATTAGARSTPGPARPRWWPSRCSTWPRVGARPVALVNCLNFGNPEHPEVMWQFSESVDGMADACRALGIPVIGGNVSFYNESRGRDIDPTPIVGVLGLVDRLDRRPPGVDLAPGSQLLLVGPDAEPAAGRPLGPRRLPPGLGPRAPRRCPARARPRPARGRGRCGPRPRARRVAHRCARPRRRWPRPGAGRAGGTQRPRRAPRRAAGCGCRVALPGAPVPCPGLRRRGPGRRGGRPPRAGPASPCSRVGSVEGERLAVTDAGGGTLVDLAAAEVVDRWRRALPDLLASGTTQG